MKGLKLLGIFVLVCAIVIGIFFVPDLIRSEGGGSGSEELTDYEQLVARVTSSWKEEDIDIYNVFVDNHYSICHLDDDYSFSKVDALRNSNTQTAVEKTFDRAKELWSDASCRVNDIRRIVATLDSICLTDSLAGYEENFQTLKRVNNVYNRARSFVQESYEATPRFNGQSWTPFSVYAKSVGRRKESIQENSDYRKYLSNISEIKNGLNSVESKLSSAKDKYYSGLKDLIEDHFKNIRKNDRERGQLEVLTDVMQCYRNETGQNVFGELYREYLNDVEANEERKKNGGTH